MSRPSFRRPSSRRSGLLSGATPVYIGALTLIVIVILIVRLAAPGAFSYVLTPVWGAGTHLSSAIGNIFSFQSRASLMQQRDELQAENTALAAENAALSARAADLTNLLGTRTAPAKGVVASVVARPPVAPYDVLIIDQGASDGVATGAAAYGSGGTPLGTVSETTSHTARIQLFSAPGVKTEGWAGSGRIPLTLTGAGSGAFHASVAKEAGVAVGDGVYISGNGAEPIGTITAIESDPSSPSVVLDIRPYANPFSLVWVTIERTQ